VKREKLKRWRSVLMIGGGRVRVGIGGCDNFIGSLKEKI
jgi:hypothetical protein